MQDKRGFMWIGTDDGLNRFDGNRFVVFRNIPGNPVSVSGNIITDILEDENEVLWIATADGGLTRYDYREAPHRIFIQYRHIPDDSTSIPVNVINDLVLDEQGYLWLATSGNSVIRFDRKKNKFEMPVSSGTKTALDMSVDKTGMLWVGREGGSILKVDTKTLSYISDERYLELYNNLPHKTVTAIYHDKEGHTWFGSWDNVLYRINASSRSEEVFNMKSAIRFPEDEVLSFQEDLEGKIWMGGRHAGLTIYDRAKSQFFNFRYNPTQEGSIANDRVNSVFRDRNGMMWLGTNMGISVYDPKQQPFVQTFLANDGKKRTIYDFYIDENDDLFIGTNDGIYLKKKGTGNFIHRPVSYNGVPVAVTKFFKGRDGNLYLGTDYTLFIYNKGNNSVTPLPNTEQDQVMSKIIDSRVVSVVDETIDGNPSLLVSPYGHFLAYYDKAEQRWVSRKDSAKQIIEKFNLKDNLIRKFYRGRNNKLWLATGKMGLGEWTNASTPKVTWWRNNPSLESSISNNNVYDLIEDDNGNLWISTYGGGLNYFDLKRRTFEHIRVSKNLLEGIALDSTGNVWMISNGSLHKYNPLSKAFSSYPLPDLDKVGGVMGSIYRDREGYMYVGGNNYFIRFKPEQINDREVQPKVYFTDLRIFNTSFSSMLTGEPISLRYKQNYFTIEYAAPEFGSGPVKYSYKLEGWDQDWIDAGDRTFANYSNLEGGNYTFMVRASTKGSWSDDVAQLSIRIIPPYWKTWWFYAISAIVLAFAVYFIYRYRINELLKRQAIRNQIAQDLHDSVGSTLSSISVYSHVAKIQHERGNKTELTEVLEKIGVTSTDMISEMNDIVWALNPRNDSMEKILLRMESFAKPLLQAKGIQFQFNYDPAVLEENLPMEKRKNFYLIFKEAVNNALKYSGCKNLHVAINKEEQHLVLRVSDDGKGFDKEQLKVWAARSLSGNGLNNMKRRAEEMKGECVINSNLGEGTGIILRFPIT